MMNNNNKILADKKADEIGGFMFSSGIKIFDPETKEIILNKRGDE